MQLKNVQSVLKKEDLVSFRCGNNENRLKTIYLDKNAKVVIEWDENDGRLSCYRGFKNGYLFVILPFN